MRTRAASQGTRFAAGTLDKFFYSTVTAKRMKNIAISKSAKVLVGRIKEFKLAQHF